MIYIDVQLGNAQTDVTWYASAAAYVRRFGCDEAAQLLSDASISVSPANLLASVTTSTMPPGITADEAAATDAAVQRLERALGITTNLMDGYLRAVVSLPIAADDANAGALEECCCHLTRYSLSSAPGTMSDAKRDENTRWLGWLRDISARRVQLISTQTQDPAAGPAAVRTGRARSGYDWTAHGHGTGYRE